MAGREGRVGAVDTEEMGPDSSRNFADEFETDELISPPTVI
jgi:hypothetical protein